MIFIYLFGFIESLSGIERGYNNLYGNERGNATFNLSGFYGSFSLCNVPCL